MEMGLRRMAAFAGIVAMVALAPAAGAEPTDGDPSTAPTAGTAPAASAPAPAPADATTLPLDDLGSSNTIWFDARQDITSSTFSFVVPKGLTPTSLNATIELPVNLRFGNMTVTQDGRTVSRLPLPADDQAPMVIPLTGLEFSDNWASVTLTVTALPRDDYYCWDPKSPIRLVNSSITFTGREVVPATVADFLPPTLRRVSIAMPTNPSLAESEAAIQLAAAMTTRYGWQNTDIVVVPLPEGALALPEPAPPRERQIVVKEGPDPGVSLQPGKGIPALLITGPGAELTNQTRLLTDPSLAFALSPKAVAGPLATEQKPVRNSTTLDKLKLTRLSAESLRPEVDVKIDQSMFAQPLQGIRVHLLGSYTPLAGNFNGEVTVAIGDEVIDRWPVDDTGTIDRWVDIPDKLVQRITMLRVRVHTTGDPGHCNDYLNLILRIDGSTEIEGNRASPPVPPGLRSLPQALMPRIQVGLGPNTFGDTVRAAQIIVGLQRNSAIPLVTAVTTLDQAIGSGEPAILIAADGWTDNRLAIPFTADLGTITIQAYTESGDPVTLNLDPAIKYGSLQTVFDGQRSVLVATSNDNPAQLDELLRWLAQKPNRWAALDGRAVISVPGTDPVTVPNRRTDLPTQQGTGSSAKGGTGWIWWAAGAIAAVSLLGALLILRRTAKPTTTTADAGPQTGDAAPQQQTGDTAPPQQTGDDGPQSG